MRERFTGRTISQIREQGIPKKDFLIKDVLQNNDLALAYSKPGVGKTLLAGAWAALAVSGNSLCGRWKAQKPTSVFLFDTEMHLSTIEERLKAEFQHQGFDDIPDKDLQIFNRTANGGSIPDICNKRDRDELSNIFMGSELVLLDSLSNMFRSGDDNAAQSWAEINEWLSDLRTRHTVVAFYHANKEGNFRGSSKIGDVYDTIWFLGGLEKERADSTSFFMQIEKDRNNIWGNQSAIGLTRNDPSSGKLLWETCKVSKNPKAEQAMQMLLGGMSQQEIAEALNVRKSTVSKWKYKAIEEGEIEKSYGNRRWQKGEINDDIPF